MKNETLDYLRKINGGDWSTDEKKNKLYDLVIKASEEFKDTTPLSVEIGVFGGVSLFCMATAHKDLKKGFAIGIDSWDNVTPLEGTNHPDNNKWWGTLDIKSVFNAFVKDTTRKDWSDFVKYLKGRSDSFAGEFADESITVFHQDGNHNVECITRELELWSPKVKTGGYWVADDTNWVEAADGYAKLPSFGFELVQDFTTWQIWKKGGVKIEFDNTEKSTRKISGKIRIKTFGVTDEKLNEPIPEGEFPVFGGTTEFYKVGEVVKVENGVANAKEDVMQASSDTPPEGSFAWMALQGQKEKEEKIVEAAKPNTSPVKEGAIRLGNLDVKPMMIYIPDTPEWEARGEKGLAHFKEQGIDNIFVATGFHGEKWGIQGRHIYLADGRPEEQYYIGHGKVAGNLTQYLTFVVMDALDYTHFLSLEDDCRFKEGWKEKLDAELMNVPADFDILFVGSCCCGGKMGVHVKGDVYEFPYRGKDKWNWMPQCSHALLIAKKCVPFLIATNRDVANPSDVSLVMNSFPKLKIFAILPRLAEQENTHLPE